MMTANVTNALYGYFETLYDLNRNIIMLCGLDVIDNAGQYEKRLQEVIQDIPRLIPYKKKKGSEEYVIDKHDGLLEFNAQIPLLDVEYENILKKHCSILVNIKKVRNKFEHKMHAARLTASGSGSISLFEVTYTINGEEFASSDNESISSPDEFTLTASELIDLLKDLNQLFAKIQNLVKDFTYENNTATYAYYRRMTRYDFCNFNKIYESNVLRHLGAALFPF